MGRLVGFEVEVDGGVRVALFFFDLGGLVFLPGVVEGPINWGLDFFIKKEVNRVYRLTFIR